MGQNESEEQGKLNQVIENLDNGLKNISIQAYENKQHWKKYKDTPLSEAYGDLVHTIDQGTDIVATRKDIERSRKELYGARLVIRDQHGETTDMPVGLHGYWDGKNQIIYSWSAPVVGEYVLAKMTGTVEYNEFLFNLLMNRQITLHDDEVKKVIDLFNRLDKETEKLISDEFLADLAKRKDESGFRNIVFSIQEEQSKIIQTPYDHNIIVQGCAGSGKSMIMLHRLPILLYTRRKYTKSDIYVISPSDTYVEMAADLLNDLEISDLSIGTLQNYYKTLVDRYNIEKTPYTNRLSTKALKSDVYRYVYSSNLTSIIDQQIRLLIENSSINIETIKEAAGLSDIKTIAAKTPYETINSRIHELQSILDQNNSSKRYILKDIDECVKVLTTTKNALKNRNTSIVNQITVSIENEMTFRAELESELLHINKDAHAVQYGNKFNSLEASRVKENKLREKLDEIYADEFTFDSYIMYYKKIENHIAEFNDIDNKEISNEQLSEYYTKYERLKKFIKDLYEHLIVMKDPYFEYDSSFLRCKTALSNFINRSMDLFSNSSNLISDEEEKLIKDALDRFKTILNTIVYDVYKYLTSEISKLDNRFNDNVCYEFTPFIFLKVLYEYRGAPIAVGNGLIAIDEAQTIEIEEYRLIKQINPKAFFNLYGDINQRIAGEKGIDGWNKIDELYPSDHYEMEYNYRNSKQITQYCTDSFGIKMTPINIDADPVIEVDSWDKMMDWIESEDDKPNHLSAIIYKTEHVLDQLKKKCDQSKVNYINSEKQSFDGDKINILPVALSKGLEFRDVLVIEEGMDKNEKYIACTRALHSLSIFDYNQETVDVTSGKDNHKKRHKMGEKKSHVNLNSKHLTIAWAGTNVRRKPQNKKVQEKQTEAK